jgi:hypothetical protein
MQTCSNLCNGINHRLKILALGPQEAWPPTDGGREGIYGALHSLAAGADILYACPATSRNDSAVDRFRSIVIGFHPIAFTPTYSVTKVLFATLLAKPFKFRIYFIRETPEQSSTCLLALVCGGRASAPRGATAPPVGRAAVGRRNSWLATSSTLITAIAMATAGALRA